MSVQKRIVVCIGTGGMGLAAVRRTGLGATVVLADFDEVALQAAADRLRGEGFDVVVHLVDVAQAKSVHRLATDAAALGPVSTVIHTAGLSPVQASVDAILTVDLLGTALVLDAFGAVIAPGGSGVFIASMAGHLARLTPELEVKLAMTPTAELLRLAELEVSGITDSGAAYSLSKRANAVRVCAASVAWGERGARVNSISPGIISTPMGAQELAGPNGEQMRGMIAGSATGRIGTPADIAAAVAFLTGPDSTFITGTDLLVDGGVIASLTTRTQSA
ncbi:SDR family oxidoreductase [Cryobacterium sp. TMT1-21]|uniref:SDR family oxidoreductase n=1 Tax=Cryobacterium shii TaxID=1259235 RepID=A0AAQ2HH41_9MICO|nr:MULTISPECIES: SDR family oxidoreductase [Cryobacterium]TFC52228.1 SDR family oxidoreductase [Cryobacterium shii]TFC88469.1 SDR family oxidoreductase [Cryobacterium sp. TmT2-59]TFD11939.1 SDR family oxidoreductase [Cryobacterium sp. TMT1-21]TFD18945.1 SDR family oxidoreductase [Cryobacterium sp. TMT2-23]TFD20977.1 SDR family oxidoreductase [Cryobacterium sp. TMT4-10]